MNLMMVLSVVLLLASIGLVFVGLWWLRGRLVALGLLGLAIVGVLVWARATTSGDSAAIDPHPDSSFRILAMGDSYSSGEGASRYFPGTDEPSLNKCRRASTAYPYLVADGMGASLTFAACSGATTRDILGHERDGESFGQYPSSPVEVLGAEPQIDLFRSSGPFDLVLLGIGGNDAGFGEIARTCALPGADADCRLSAAQWVQRIDEAVYPALVQTYNAVKSAAGAAPVYVLTYPNPLGPVSCPALPLGSAEVSFLRDVFIPHLNDRIRFAAAVAEVHLIDVEDALVGQRICEVPPSRAGVNILAIGRTRGTRLEVSIDGIVGLGHGTFHPNYRGHAAIAAVVRHALDTRRTPSAGSPGPPDLPSGLPNVPPVPPPFVPEEVGPPLGPYPFPPDTECTGSQIEVVTAISVEEATEELEITDLPSRSRVCHRSYRGDWRSASASENGRLTIDVGAGRVGLGSTTEVLVPRGEGRWEKLVVSRTPDDPASIDPEYEVPWRPALAVVGLVLLAMATLLVLRWRSLSRERGQRVGSPRDS